MLVKFGSLDLGFTRDGVTIRIEPRWLDVPSDDFAGANGIPSDAQFMGAIALIQADLTKYDKDEVRKLTSFEKAGTAGVLPQLGTLIRQEEETSNLELDGKNEDWLFDVAFNRQALEVNKGTRYSTFVCGWEAWIGDTQARVLFGIT